MKLLFLDSTAVCSAGPGSPAFFSRYAIEHFRALGHEVEILGSFQPDACRAADVVITEWANQEAYEAAASGLCRKLIVHMRGFDAHGPLDQMEWANVDALVYESPFLKSYVEKRFPGLRGFRSHVIPSGVDVENIPFKNRGHGKVVAMVGRATELKGHQLAFEWARRRPDIQLHVAMALGASNPRLMEYARHVKPGNVTLYPGVDTVKWLDEIDANYLLSASIWETLGYTIAEAMAMGIKPLIHGTPGAEENWPGIGLWLDFDDLDTLGPQEQLSSSYTSDVYRHFVEEHLDAYHQSAKFADLALAPPTRALASPPSAVGLILQVEAALQANQLASADATLLAFRDRTPRLKGFDDHRSGLALKLAAAYVNAGDLDRGRVWALRSLGDIVRVDTLCLLGEIAAVEGDLENAERWYDASLDVSDQATRYPTSGLGEGRGARCVEIARALRPVLPREAPVPHRFLIVVAVRNAEKYIGACLESIKAQPQTNKLCVVIDDDSTDATYEIASAYGGTFGDLTAGLKNAGGFFVMQQGPRNYSLRNIVQTIQAVGHPTDIVVIVDGDDQLDPYALSVIEDAYNRGAWMTYGNFKTSSGRTSWMPPYPYRVIKANDFRAYPWSVSHPKTFRKALFDKINVEDFQHEGEWFKTAGDVALMMPMLEMAAERAVYLPAPIYVWNDQNELSDHRVDPDGQVRVRNLILSKPAKKRLEEL